LTPPRNGLRFHPCRATSAADDGGNAMKGMNQKKSEKKKPAKTMKEKRADKQAKKSAKG
jgi:hypothetical protein